MSEREINKSDERAGLPSPSSWGRRELCAGSYQLELEAERLNQSAHKYSPDAERGELIHAYLAGTPDEDGKEIKLSESERQTADFLQERAQEQIERIFGGQEYKQLAEKRLWLSLDGKPALSGRFDLVAYTPQLALVIDYKTGWSEPDPAQQNAQMRVLACLVGLALPLVEEVVVQIVSGPFGVFEARFDLKELSEIYNGIVKTLRAINDPHAGFSPSPDACKFCGAKLICQAVKDTVISPMTKLQFSALPDGGPRAAKLLDEVVILRSLLNQIEEFYGGKFNDPTYSIPGYAMAPGTVRREVTDWETARSRLGEYLDVGDISGAANYRLGDLEKALGKVLKLKGKPLKDRMNQILDGLYMEKQNSASLKRVKGEARIASLESA